MSRLLAAAYFIIPSIGVFPLSAAAEDSHEVSEKVVEYATAKLGEQVGNGECWTLAKEALTTAGAKRPGKDGYQVYEFGRRVKGDEAPQPGDVIQFYDARFEGHGRSSRMKRHTAIIETVNGTELGLLHQNWNGSRNVSRITIDLADRKEGRVLIFRPQVRQ